jgi:hypothetical protein
VAQKQQIEEGEDIEIEDAEVNSENIEENVTCPHIKKFKLIFVHSKEQGAIKLIQDY